MTHRLVRLGVGSRLVAWLAIAGLAAGCSVGLAARSGPPASASRDAVDLLVFGAASLTDVLAAVETAYEAAVPGTTLTIATDSSSTLRTQIEQGAPADVFLSADRDSPRVLADGGLADGNIVDFAANRLTIIVPAGDPAAIARPADLAKPGVRIIAAGDDVPITTYASEAVARLAAVPGYPAEFAGAYLANVVSKEQNVRAIVAKIELGEGDAAIVYATDAIRSSAVKVIELPPEADVSATYAGIVVGTSAHPAQAHAFLEWLKGPGGAAVLATFGFLPPS